MQCEKKFAGFVGILRRGSFSRHANKFKIRREGFELNVEKLKKWKMALREAANLSGYHFKQGYPILRSSPFFYTIVTLVLKAKKVLHVYETTIFQFSLVSFDFLNLITRYHFGP